MIPGDGVGDEVTREAREDPEGGSRKIFIRRNFGMV